MKDVTFGQIFLGEISFPPPDTEPNSFTQGRSGPCIHQVLASSRAPPGHWSRPHDRVASNGSSADHCGRPAAAPILNPRPRHGRTPVSHPFVFPVHHWVALSRWVAPPRETSRLNGSGRCWTRCPHPGCRAFLCVPRDLRGGTDRRPHDVPLACQVPNPLRPAELRDVRRVESHDADFVARGVGGMGEGVQSGNTRGGSRIRLGSGVNHDLRHHPPVMSRTRIPPPPPPA